MVMKNIEKLDELKARKGKAKTLNLTGILFIVLGVILGALMFFGVIKVGSLQTIAIIAGVPFIVGIIFIIIYSSEYGKYKSVYKDIIVESALDNFLDEHKYIPNKGFDYSFVRKTGLIGMGDNFKSSDYIEGKYKDVDFRQSDIYVTETRVRTDSKGHTTTETVTLFKGKWSIYSFNKEFEENVYCIGKNFSDSRVGGLFSDLNKVELESDDFNKAFKTYSSDSGHTAFYLLTPQVMEEIMKLGKAYKYRVMFAFMDNSLHVLVNDYHDYLEPSSIYSNLEIEEEIKKIEKELKNSVIIMDKLKLNDKLFKGGN